MKIFAASREQIPSKHKYISLIEFSLGNPKFSVNVACAACGLSEKEFRFISNSIYVLNAAQADMGHNPDIQFDWILSPDAYFSYLQYLEFKHAIEAARRSYWLSVAAIVIAIISAGLAIGSGT